jgi:hypothetical protein
MGQMNESIFSLVVFNFNICRFSVTWPIILLPPPCSPGPLCSLPFHHHSASWRAGHLAVTAKCEEPIHMGGG